PMLPRTLARTLRAAGFEEILATGHAFVTTELDPETYGGMVLGRVEQYLSEHGGVDPEEARAWVREQRDLGSRGEYFFAIVQCCFTASRPGS
ncbi:MAG: methyltransferase, partial [Candidatus Eisenbacteria bacterium]|nr:methyltransferase [Candidatus Eisenbacteria bacterium]